MRNRLFTLLFATLIGFASCTKEQASPSGANPSTNTTDDQRSVFGKAAPVRAYQESFSATSTISGTANGVYNPGSGFGNATHLGNATMCFNQLVTIVNGQPVGSTAAPVNQFYAGQLAAAGIKNVPNTVSSITYDKDGNAVWFTSSTGTLLTPVSSTQVNFTATLDIIGGSGKFEGATGQVVMTGHFNPQLSNQAASIQSKGSISY